MKRHPKPLRAEPLETRCLLAADLVARTAPPSHEVDDQVAAVAAHPVESPRVGDLTDDGLIGFDPILRKVVDSPELPELGMSSQWLEGRGLSIPPGGIPGVDALIVGGDNRVQLGEPEVAMGRLWTRWPNGSETFGTGTLFSQRHVLTAGQNVYSSSRGGWASEIIFSPGQSGTALYDPIYDTSFRRSDGQDYSEARATIFRTLSRWVNNNDVTSNMGFLTLDRNIGNLTEWFDYAARSDSFFVPTQLPYLFEGLGYAGSGGGFEQYGARGAVTSLITTVLNSDIDMSGGQIGGPLRRCTSGTNGVTCDQTIYGVWGAQRSSVPDNGFIRITSGRFDAMQDMVSNDGPATDRADLVDYDVWFDARLASMSTTSVRAGDSFSVTAYPRNNGTATAANYTVSFYASSDDTISSEDYLLGSTSISSTDPLAFSAADLSTSFPDSIPGGTYHVGWLIDSGSTIDEYFESNNTGLISGSQLAVLPADITPDIFEQNDTFATAANLPSGDQNYAGLTIDAPNDDDYYAWAAPAHGDLIVDVGFAHANGDVNVELFDNSGNLLDGSYSTGDSEQVSAAVVGGERYVVRVYGDSGATNPDYTMMLDGPESSSAGPGDFNDDGQFDCADIDALTQAIAAGTNDAAFDLSGDGLVDLVDRDQWLVEAGAANLASGAPYLLGDANLNGVVDLSDFNIWNTNKFTLVASWCRGDFNADGGVDISDFNSWNRNKFTTSALVTTELPDRPDPPEPTWRMLKEAPPAVVIHDDAPWRMANTREWANGAVHGRRARPVEDAEPGRRAAAGRAIDAAFADRSV